MTEHSSDERRDRSATRRRFLRGGAAAAGAALAPSLAGRASAAATETPTGGGNITVAGALPADAPTFGSSDYVGLVLQVGNRTGGADPSGIGSCPFVQTGTAAEEGTYTAIDADKIWAYNAEISERGGGSTETTTLFSLAQNTTLGPDKRYIINDQQKCGDYVQVQLEMLSESGQGPETTVSGGGGGGEGEGTTETSTPGFGVLAALGGVGAAAGALAFRGDDE